MPDPVHQDDANGQWYFWDETWADRHGPYPNEKTCRNQFHRYVDIELDGIDPTVFGAPLREYKWCGGLDGEHVNDCKS